MVQKVEEIPSTSKWKASLCTTVQLGEEIISYKHIKDIFDLLHFEILLLALFKLLLTYHSFLIECFGII